MTEQITKADLKEELGEKADKETVDRLTNAISLSWKFKEKPPAKPVLVYLGGFQGSGKTTTLELVRPDLDLIIISTDEIRHQLFEGGWEVNEKFKHTVNATRNSLLRKALAKGHHIAIDQRTTQQRIELAKKIAQEVNKNYRLVFVYLDAPENVLKQRVVTRQPFPGKYNGTLEELMVDINTTAYPINLGLYDRVIDSSRTNPQAIATEIKRFFKRLN